MSELQKRLRMMKSRACDEAADALDAQAQEIASLRDKYNDLFHERTELRARLADAERDRDRLEWLCLNRNECIDGEAFSNAVTIGQLRAWIDAARGGA